MKRLDLSGVQEAGTLSLIHIFQRRTLSISYKNLLLKQIKKRPKPPATLIFNHRLQI